MAPQTRTPGKKKRSLAENVSSDQDQCQVEEAHLEADELETAAESSNTPFPEVGPTSRSLQEMSSFSLNPASGRSSRSSNPTQGLPPFSLQPQPQDQTAEQSVGKLRWRGAPREDDLTTVKPDQRYWSIHNLPDILYVLKPKGVHTKSRARVPKTTSIFGNQVNYFPVLPDQISSRVEGWRVEAWSRMDRRITPQDIIDRVNPAYKITASEIQMRRYRFRQEFNVAAWGSGSSIAAITRTLEGVGLDPAQNTTRGLTPGLINPAVGEAGGRIPLPDNWNDFDSTRHPSQQGSPRLKRTSHRAANEFAPIRNTTESQRHEPRPRKRSRRHPTFEDTWRENFPEYPDQESNLAVTGRQARDSIDEAEESTTTMELQEYLKKSGQTYEDWVTDESKDRPSDSEQKTFLDYDDWEQTIAGEHRARLLYHP
ncbi:hypothetical protein VTN00DRAFT_6221 [Thermoascus crustaceus]|uniref:uncharacterized protein n=1 Tax=Thermoascus crustaceus TaxID=5088 RepID=UPI003741F0EB